MPSTLKNTYIVPGRHRDFDASDFSSSLTRKSRALRKR